MVNIGYGMIYGQMDIYHPLTVTDNVLLWRLPLQQKYIMKQNRQIEMILD